LQVTRAAIRALWSKFGDSIHPVYLQGTLHAENEKSFIGTLLEKLDLETNFHNSFSDALHVVMERIRDLSSQKHTTIIILDDFELFATETKTQTSKFPRKYAPDVFAFF
jgi:hypothetical protein